VTVCIAAICNWNYGTLAQPSLGTAAIVITDRMITAGDVQYEPPQTKQAHITPKVVIVIAGDYSVHSQALKKTAVHFETKPDASPEDVAIFYGRAIQTIKLKEAEDLYLAPLGLNSDSFLAQQDEMSSHFVAGLTDQMQGHRGAEVDALVVGSMPNNGKAAIYGVDAKGMITCHDDVGFASIGIGSWHAKSKLMQAGYASLLPFTPALSYAFAAKKSAEVAPGVGSNTDVLLVFRNEIIRLWPHIATKLNDLFVEYSSKVRNIEQAFLDELQGYISQPTAQDANDPPKGIPGGGAQANERVTPPAAETPQTDEAGQKETR
jgi:20S proteasome alpha/beta subunit